MGIGFHSKQDHPDLYSPTAQLVRDWILTNGVVIFSKTYCPYCKMAKEVFDSLDCKYEVIELDEREDGDHIQHILGLMTGARTVPRVFVDGKFIGGGNDVKRLYENGCLQTMIQKMNAEAEELRRVSMIRSRRMTETDTGERPEGDWYEKGAACLPGTAAGKYPDDELEEMERAANTEREENERAANGGENEVNGWSANAGEPGRGRARRENRRGPTGESLEDPPNKTPGGD